MRAEPEKHGCVYGPVPSRRLGRSLGIDLVPFKTCTYDCVYCQIGRTTNKTVERREYVPVAAVLAELERKLAKPDTPDCISLAGSGEPTLNSGIGRLVARIKDMTDVPVAVITNGSLLWMKEVQDELLMADVVLPSLDAGDADVFERVNRPSPAIGFDLMVDGLVSFAKRFQGEVWLEVMLLVGMTGTPAEAKKIATLVATIAPARTQLNTASRPPGEGFMQAVPAEQMSALSGPFSGQVDIICDFAGGEGVRAVNGETADADILALLGRRPCTAHDVAAGLGLHVLDALKRLDILLAAKRIRLVVVDDKAFYMLSSAESNQTT